MSYAQKLKSITERQQKLNAEKNKLLEQRKKEVANLVERYGLLHFSDEVLSEIFQKAKAESIPKPESVSNWESEGGNPSPDPTVT
jgi:hypothetical protein